MSPILNFLTTLIKLTILAALYWTAYATVWKSFGPFNNDNLIKLGPSMIMQVPILFQSIADLTSKFKEPILLICKIVPAMTFILIWILNNTQPDGPLVSLALSGSVDLCVEVVMALIRYRGLIWNKMKQLKRMDRRVIHPMPVNQVEIVIQALPRPPLRNENTYSFLTTLLKVIILTICFFLAFAGVWSDYGAFSNQNLIKFGSALMNQIPVLAQKLLVMVSRASEVNRLILTIMPGTILILVWGVKGGESEGVLANLMLASSINVIVETLVLAIWLMGFLCIKVSKRLA